MNKDSMHNDASKEKAAKKDLVVFDKLVVNEDHWNIITMILLVLTAFWHLRSIAGWLNGNTLVQVYGIDTVLAKAIAASPDILFHSTYYAMAVSIGMFIFTLVLIAMLVFDRREASEVLSPAMLCTMITTWAFPVIYVLVDLLATAFKVRETLNFDVFQLGIQGLPLVIITVVSFVIMQLNKRVNLTI